jgi:hypothetical protein
MARIEALELDEITFNFGNAILTMRFRVEFNQHDQDAKNPYKLVCKLKGHDPAEGEFGEVNDGDDEIPDGLVTPPGGLVVRADGVASQEFEFTKTIDKDNLNEDFFGAADPDEIKVKVTLDPILPEKTSAESIVRTLVATS